MAKFRSVPQPRSEEEFVNSAEPPAQLAEKKPDIKPAATVATAMKPKPQPKPKKGRATSKHPWLDHDPADRATINQTVRLNQYQYEKLQWIAAKEDRSLAQVLRRLLTPALNSATD